MCPSQLKDLCFCMAKLIFVIIKFCSLLRNLDSAGSNCSVSLELYISVRHMFFIPLVNMVIAEMITYMFLVIRLYRSAENTNQRILFDIDPSGQHLGTGGQVSLFLFFFVSSNAVDAQSISILCF